MLESHHMPDLHVYGLLILIGASVLIVFILLAVRRYIDYLQASSRTERMLDELREQFERGVITWREYDEWSRTMKTRAFASI